MYKTGSLNLLLLVCLSVIFSPSARARHFIDADSAVPPQERKTFPLVGYSFEKFFKNASSVPSDDTALHPVDLQERSPVRSRSLTGTCDYTLPDPADPFCRWDCELCDCPPQTQVDHSCCNKFCSGSGPAASITVKIKDAKGKDLANGANAPIESKKGSGYTFTGVAAGGTPGYTYEWKKAKGVGSSDTVICSTAACEISTNVAAKDAGTYQCEVTDSASASVTATVVATYASCTDDSDCGPANAATCEGSPKVCKCKDNFVYQDDGKCGAAATTTNAGTTKIGHDKTNAGTTKNGNDKTNAGTTNNGNDITNAGTTKNGNDNKGKGSGIEALTVSVSFLSICAATVFLFVLI